MKKTNQYKDIFLSLLIITIIIQCFLSLEKFNLTPFSSWFFYALFFPLVFFTLSVTAFKKIFLQKYKTFFTCFFLVAAITFFLDGISSLIIYQQSKTIIKKDSRYNLYINGWQNDQGLQKLIIDAGKGKFGLYPANKQYKMMDSTATIDNLGFRREIERPSELASQSGKTVILSLGGSVAFGMTSQKEELPYPDMLEQQLNKTMAESKFYVYNTAAPGFSISSFKDKLEKWQLLKPQIVVFYEGVNTLPHDVKGKAEHYNSFLITLIHNWYIKERGIKNVQHYQAEAYKQGLRTLISQSRDIGAAPILVTFSIPFTENSSQETLAYWDVMQNGQSSAYAEAMIVKRHNQAMREVAKQGNVLLVETTPFLNNKPEYFVDSAHLTPAGHKILAELVAQKILNEVIYKK